MMRVGDSIAGLANHGFEAEEQTLARPEFSGA
jgi:hypothetical protein